MALAPAERTRLVAMLGRLGSDHDGERAAAGLLVSRLLRDKGLAWDDVVAPAAPTRPAADDWRAQAAEAARYPGLLTPWERDFLRVLTKFRDLSPKQSATLEAILAKVGVQ